MAIEPSRISPDLVLHGSQYTLRYRQVAKGRSELVTVSGSADDQLTDPETVAVHSPSSSLRMCPKVFKSAPAFSMSALLMLFPNEELLKGPSCRVNSTRGRGRCGQVAGSIRTGQAWNLTAFRRQSLIRNELSKSRAERADSENCLKVDYGDDHEIWRVEM